MIPLLCLVLLLSLQPLVSPQGDNVLPEFVKQGLEEGNSLMLNINNVNVIKKKTPEMSKTTVPYVLSLNHLWQLTTSSKLSERYSAILNLVKANSAMDTVSAQFERIRDSIDWAGLNIALGDIERTVMVLRENMMQVLRSTEAAKEYHTQFFFSQFDSSYQNAGLRLYMAVAEQNFLFGKNLIKAVREYSRNDRPKLQAFALGMTKLIIQAVEVEIAYFTFKGNKDNENFVRNYWTPKLQNLQEKFNSADKEIRDDFRQQLASDVQLFIAQRNLQKWSDINNNLVEDLLKEVGDKFDWRQWTVLAFEKPWSEQKNAQIFTCEKFVYQNKNFVIVLASRAENDANDELDEAEADRRINSLAKSVPFWSFAKVANYLLFQFTDMGNSNEKVVCERHVFAAVISNSVNTIVKHNGNLFQRSYAYKYGWFWTFNANFYAM